MDGRRHILFTATFHSSFIDRDIDLLAKNFSVTLLVTKGWTAFFRFLRYAGTADLTFSWFASVYSSCLVFLTRLLGVKSLIVLGGVDVAKEKNLNYGIWNSWWKSKIVRYGIVHANAVLAVDDFLRQEAMRLAEYNGRNIAVIPTGYDSEFWHPSGKKESLVLCVASCPDPVRIKIKGIDYLIAVARKLPTARFKIIGIKSEVAETLSLPSNVESIPHATQEQLREEYQHAKVYCQLSYRDGLPNALCEAMLCGCVPIGTTRGGIPRAIGQTGFLVDYQDEDAAVHAIRQALEAPPEQGMEARRRISTQFTLSQRESALKEKISELIS
ncbi:MAG TPA: glycosyltransferase family 4 protein [Bacteroidota bacterium]|nr:glycosyltransferase family 4 protein [Bacteroidota bacterium]